MVSKLWSHWWWFEVVQESTRPLERLKVSMWCGLDGASHRGVSRFIGDGVVVYSHINFKENMRRLW